MAERKRMGEILIEAGVITPVILQKALTKQKGTNKRLGQILEEMDVILEEDVATVLARQFGIQRAKGLSRHKFPLSLLQKIEAETALTKSIFPLKIEDKTLYLAMANPLDMELQNHLSFQTGLRIIPCVTTPEEIKTAVKKHYFGEEKRVSGDRWWTILVVDDQEMVQSAVGAALEREGFSVSKAVNGVEGIKIAMAEHPHLIISDTVMPRMDGISMFSSMQNNRTIAGIPVIALSPKATPEEEAKLLGMGFADFIAKPINPIRLVARVKHCLSRSYGDSPPA